MQIRTAIISITCVLLLILLTVTSCENPGDNGEKPVTKEEVIALLTKWHDQIEPVVAEQERQAVQAYAASYPIKEPENTDPVSVTVTEGDAQSISPVVNRKDWAYAVKGAGYSITGGIGKDQKALLDAGFWCFLEAALLQPDEPEHLGNVAFHLNLHNAFQDAKTILLYARALDSTKVNIRNNLAFAYRGLGDLEAAINEAQYVISLRPGETANLERLREYYEDAGYTDEARAIDAALDSIIDFPSVPSDVLDPELSPKGEQIRQKIKDLSKEMYDAGTEIADKYQEQLGAKTDDYLTEWALITQEALLDCPMRVGMNGGDAYAMCVNCYIPGGNSAFNLGATFYSETIPIVTAYESEAFGKLFEISSEARDLVDSSNLPESERMQLHKEMHQRIFTEHASIILGPRKEINQRWQTTVADYKAAMAEGCGDAPVGEIPTVDEESVACKMLPFMCRQWNLNLPGFTVEWKPDGTAKVSFGSFVSMKLELNVMDWHFGAGFGVGLNIGPVKPELSFMFRTKTGTEAGVDLKVKTLDVMMLPGSGTKFSIVKSSEFNN